MVRRFATGFLAASLLALLILSSACTSAAPAPAPTQAPAAAAKAPEPTKAAAAPAAQQPAAVQPATDWPKQPVTLIVPWAAGGDTDIPMRVVAEFVSKELGQPIVVQNVTGASGTTGTRQARGVKPDGYTLVSVHEHLTVNKGTGLVDYGFEAFDLIANIMFSPEFLMTEASQPWNSLKDVVDDAKKRPNQLTYGMTFGSTAQMFAFLVMHRTGVQFKPVGYDGTAQRMTALLGKQIDLAHSPLSSALEQWKAKRVKVLAFAGEKRDPRLSEVPTFKELGYDLVSGINRGWAAPKGTPKPILLRVEQAIKKATENPDLKKKIVDEMGSEIAFMTGEQYTKFCLDQEKDLLKVIKETGMSVPASPSK